MKNETTTNAPFWRKDQFYVLKKHSIEELEKLEINLVGLLKKRHNAEMSFELAKSIIKSSTKEISTLYKKIEEGGTRGYQECEILIDPNKMTKEIFFEGTLMETEKLSEWELQTKIEDYEDQQLQDESEDEPANDDNN